MDNRISASRLRESWSKGGTSDSRKFSMKHRSEITSFCFLSDFFANTNDRKTCFLGPKTRQLSKTPGNFRKRAGTSQNTRRTSQKHPENFPKTPGTFPNVPGTFQNTHGTSEHPGNFPKTG
jgi:hypothetical protein